MNVDDKPITILSSTANGRIIPYTLMDIQYSLSKSRHQVWVQDNTRFAQYHEIVLSVADGLVQLEPEAFVTIDQVGVVPEVISLLERPPRVLCWIYDDPSRFVRSCYAAINSHLHLFLWDRAYIPMLEAQGLIHCHYQPFATNPSVNRPMAADGYDYDVSFVGGSSPARIDLIRRLADEGFCIDVFGDGEWAALRHERVRYHGMADNRNDCPRIYSRSKINLNLTSEQLLSALPVRVFDVLACEGFLLTDWRRDVEELFCPGRDLAVFKNPEELAAQIRRYLDAPAERDAIRRQGRARVLAHYTFDRVLPGMLQTAFSAPLDLAANAALPPETLARYLWVVGVSYMKFGKLRAAYPRLMDALQMRPQAPENLMAMAMLAHMNGLDESAQDCLAHLGGQDAKWAEWGAQLKRCPAPALPPDSWRKLYQLVYSDLRVNENGLLSGGELRRMEALA